MARRTKAELISEIDRTYDCIEAIVDCLNEHIRTETEDRIDKRELIQLEDYYTGIESKSFTASQALAGLREGLGDFSRHVSQLAERDPGRASLILGCYREKTGRDFWDDAGNPKRSLSAILEHGKIRDETEFRLPNEYLSALDHDLLSENDRAKANDMFYAFEQDASHHPDA